VRDMLAEILHQGRGHTLFGLRQFLADVREAAKVVRGPQLSLHRKMAGLWMTSALLEQLARPP